MSTKIEWCDEVWNPIVGCSRVSRGCDHCYAKGIAHRQLSPRHRGLTKAQLARGGDPRPHGNQIGIDWTGRVRLLPDVLPRPLGWRRPRRVFVNSMSDLFHPAVPSEFVAAMFGVMAACSRHTFLLLTKRDPGSWYRWIEGREIDAIESAVTRYDLFPRVGLTADFTWPLPNVHLGVSAEDQPTWDKRVPRLLECPAALHWVSCEPLLGPIDLCPRTKDRPHVEHVVIGGESGPRARQCNVDWIRSIVKQCRQAGILAFVKQLGAHYVDPANAVGGVLAKPPDVYGPLVRRLRDHKGADLAEWPADLRVRELPEGVSVEEGDRG